MDALVYFGQALVILTVISVITVGVRWLVRKVGVDPIVVDMDVYCDLAPVDRELIDAITTRYVDWKGCQGLEMRGNKITFRMLLRDDNGKFYYDKVLDDVAFEMVTMTMTAPKWERRYLREILRRKLR